MSYNLEIYDNLEHLLTSLVEVSIVLKNGTRLKLIDDYYDLKIVHRPISIIFQGRFNYLKINRFTVATMHWYRLGEKEHARKYNEDTQQRTGQEVS